MPALGLVLAWGGYWLLTYGLVLHKGPATVTLTDLALPSHRQKVINAMQAAWGAAQPGQGQAPGAKTGPGSTTVPIFPGLPGVGPKVSIPGTNIKVQA